METDSPRLVGFEIDRRLVRATVLSSDGSDILAYADSSVMEPDTHEDVFPNPGPAVSSIWDKLQLNQYPALRVAASFGFRHAGVGSGESIAGWIDDMAEQLNEPVAVVGQVGGGVSYAPKAHVEIVREGFQSVGCELDAIELAPISVGRILASQPSCVMTIGSGIGWRVRVHHGAVLEALPYSGGVTRSGVYLEHFGQPELALASIARVAVPSELLDSQQLTVGMLAIAIGAATGLLEADSVGNFCSLLEAPKAEISSKSHTALETDSAPDLDLGSSPTGGAAMGMVTNPTSKSISDGIEGHNVETVAVSDAVVSDERPPSVAASDHDGLAGTNELGDSKGSEAVQEIDGVLDDKEQTSETELVESAQLVDSSPIANEADDELETDEDSDIDPDVTNTLDLAAEPQVESSRAAPPMPDDHLATENYVEGKGDFDPTITSTMSALPPMPPMSTELVGELSETHQTNDADGFLGASPDEQSAEVDAAPAEPSEAHDVDRIEAASVGTVAESSVDASGLANEASPAPKMMNLAPWSDSEFHGKTEVAHNDADAAPAPLDPIETQPVPPLAGIRIESSGTGDDPDAPVASSAQWQPFSSQKLPNGEPIATDSNPELVQPRYPEAGTDRGFEEIASAENGDGVVDANSGALAEPATDLVAGNSDSSTEFAEDTSVDATQTGDLSPTFAVENVPLVDNADIRSRVIPSPKPQVQTLLSELTVTGSVPVERAAAHLEAQLDAEEAETAVSAAAGDVRSIQQPGPRRAVKQPRSTVLWPVVIVGIGFVVAVAVAFYIWKIGF